MNKDSLARASLLLERSIALDPELGKHIDRSTDRLSFIRALKKSGLAQAAALGPWKVFVMEQVTRAIHDRELTTFVGGLQREPWLRGEAFVEFQAGLIGTATLNDRAEFITALLDPILRYCGNGRHRNRKTSSSLSHTRTHTSFRYSPASGACQTICRMRQGWETSRG